jgi:hypothetical protein
LIGDADSFEVDIGVETDGMSVLKFGHKFSSVATIEDIIGNLVRLRHI